MKNIILKFEVRTKDPINLTYGIWNNDMLAWQYIADWNGTDCIDLEEAQKIATEKNK